MRVKLLALQAVTLITLTGCVTAIVSGSLYSTIGWLFGDTETNDDIELVVESARIKYSDYCDTAAEALVSYYDEVISSRTENVVSCLTDLDSLFTEQSKRKFFAALLANKAKSLGEAENLIENHDFTRITTTDINNFVSDFFDYNVSVTSSTNNNITIYYADISIIKRIGLYDYLDFTQMDRDNAAYIESILIGVLENEV